MSHSSVEFVTKKCILFSFYMKLETVKIKKKEEKSRKIEKSKIK